MIHPIEVSLPDEEVETRAQLEATSVTMSLRSVVSYHLYIALITVFAFWIYYQTLDVSAISTLATTSFEANSTVTAEWAADKQSWLQSELSPLAGLSDNVKTGVTGAR